MNAIVGSRAELEALGRARPISEGSEWTFELIQRYDEAIAEVASEYGLDTYPNQIEVIPSEQMLDAYAAARLDRKGALSGKEVSVVSDPGGRRSIQKNTYQTQ